MAQNELLPPLAMRRVGALALLILVCVSSRTYGYNLAPNNATTGGQNTEQLKSVVDAAHRVVLEGIRQKYAELQRKLKKGTEGALEAQIQEEVLNQTASLRVFVSSSMSLSLLRSYVQEAKKYGAVLVFRGLPGGSWQSLSRLVADIADEEEGIGMQIDDEAYDRFNINSVPAFVLSTEDRDLWQEQSPTVFDRAIGNIGIRGFLDLVRKDGNLAEEAEAIMSGSR